MDAAIIGEFLAMFVTAFAVLFSYSYLQKKGYGIVRVFLSLIVSSLIIFYLTYAAYVVLLTDSTLIFDTSNMVLGYVSSLGGTVFFYLWIKEKFQRD